MENVKAVTLQKINNSRVCPVRRVGVPHQRPRAGQAIQLNSFLLPYNTKGFPLAEKASCSIIEFRTELLARYFVDRGTPVLTSSFIGAVISSRVFFAVAINFYPGRVSAFLFQIGFHRISTPN